MLFDKRLANSKTSYRSKVTTGRTSKSLKQASTTVTEIFYPIYEDKSNFLFSLLLCSQMTSDEVDLKYLYYIFLATSILSINIAVFNFHVGYEESFVCKNKQLFV